MVYLGSSSWLLLSVDIYYDINDLKRNIIFILYIFSITIYFYWYPISKPLSYTLIKAITSAIGAFLKFLGCTQHFFKNINLDKVTLRSSYNWWLNIITVYFLFWIYVNNFPKGEINIHWVSGYLGYYRKLLTNDLFRCTNMANRSLNSTSNSLTKYVTTGWRSLPT